jgi:hypothetical protein
MCLPIIAAAQTAPIADAYRATYKREAKRLLLSAEEMPAAKYGYKPTPAQMTFGEVVAHVANGNDGICGPIAGIPMPKRTPVAGTDSKAHLVARLQETFDFCDKVLPSLDDTKLGESVTDDEGETSSRALLIISSMGHWGDHYSQMAIYLRLNGLLPPTAKDPTL